MKTILKILIPIITFVAGTYMVAQLQINGPNLVYNITEPIFISGSNENIQQIQISNRGNEKAAEIHIFIKQAIIKHDFSKASAKDNYEVFKESNKTELIYPFLTPEDSIAVTIFTENKINVDDIEVQHSKGQAKYALGNKSSFQYFLNAFPIILTLIYLLFVCHEIFISSLERNFNSKKTLMKKKPLIISKEKWLTIREEALESYANNKFNYNFQLNDMITLLNGGEPSYLSHTEWQKLKKNVEERLKEVLTNKIYSNTYLGFDNVEMILKLNKPTDYNDQEWNKIRETAIKTLLSMLSNEVIFSSINDIKSSKCYGYLDHLNIDYLTRKESLDFIHKLETIFENKLIKNMSIKFYSNLDLLEFLSEGMPQRVSIEKAQDIRTALLNIYTHFYVTDVYKDFDELIIIENRLHKLKIKSDELVKASNLIKQRYLYEAFYSLVYKPDTDLITSKLNESFIGKDKYNILISFSYNLKFYRLLSSKNIENINTNDYEWIKDDDKIKLDQWKKDITDSKTKVKEYDHLIEILINALKGIQLQINVDDISPDNLAFVKEQSNLLIQFANNRDVVNKNKNTIIRQLEIINNLLKDPSSIHKIENYDNPFSSGNFESLLQVSKLMSCS